ncbi:phosphotransferase family protein [Halorussus halophilus]|uniref:phosphotransferase family protein n=1 Tax=Halorussus halophilus TaxID=2650975 RepID=UPI001301802C|nr:aminoglycoside phosphotransferase family protein [Halorussus halophilus]
MSDDDAGTETDSDADADAVADAEDATDFSPETLTRMVREIRPEWRLRESRLAPEGTDAVYFVTVETGEGTRECVLKICDFLDPEAFRPEPHLVALIDAETSIPVPSVVGTVDYHEELPAPFFLMEKVDGENLENQARELAPEVVERVARNAGRNLGELHALGDFEQFGPIRLTSDVDSTDADAKVHVEATDRPLVVGETGQDTLRPRIEEVAEYHFENLDERFADLESDLRAFIDERLDALDSPDRALSPTITHFDYRFGNLLVDPETGETKVVLDWGNVSTNDPQNELVYTEQYLSGWATHDDPLRSRVRTALREGYSETNELERDPEFERRRELYLAASRLSPLVWFDMWYAAESEAEQKETERRHRQAVRELFG